MHLDLSHWGINWSIRTITEFIGTPMQLETDLHGSNFFVFDMTSASQINTDENRRGSITTVELLSCNTSDSVRVAEQPHTSATVHQVMQHCCHTFFHMCYVLLLLLCAG